MANSAFVRNLLSNFRAVDLAVFVNNRSQSFAFGAMIVRHIKLQNGFQLESARINDIERLTDTKLLVEPECIQIVGEARKSRQARLLIQHSILLAYLNAANPEPLREQSSAPKTFNWQQLTIEAIKRAVCAFNTTINLISNH